MESQFGHTLFTEEQVTGAIGDLSDYEVYDEVASLSLENETAPDALIAFANLSKALKLPVRFRYGSSLCIRRRKPDGDLRDIAVARLQRQAEAGEIEAKAA